MLCFYGCGQEGKFYFPIAKKWCCSKFFMQCPEVRYRTSENSIGSKNGFYGRHHKKEFLSSQSILMKKYRKDPESVFNQDWWKQKRTNSIRVYSHTEEGRKTRKEAVEERWKDPEQRRRQSELLRRLFEDPTFVEKWGKAIDERPTKPEKFLKELLSSIFSEKYEYVGNRKFWIGRKNPDFVNKRERRIIEFFGWHHTFEYRSKFQNDFKTNKKHEQERKELFKKYGYETLVLWEKDLKNLELLKKKIILFETKKDW